jgi:hypothetical protein
MAPKNLALRTLVTVRFIPNFGGTLSSLPSMRKKRSPSLATPGSQPDLGRRRRRAVGQPWWCAAGRQLKCSTQWRRAPHLLPVSIRGGHDWPGEHCSMLD